LAQHPVGQAETGGDGRRFGLGGVPPEHVQALLGIGVSVQCLVAPIGHRELGVAEVRHDDVQAAAGEHPVAGQLVEVAGPRVLRQVADAAATVDLAPGRLRLTGQHPGERGLACAVTADQPDPVALADPERGVIEQQSRASAQLDTGGGDHGRTPRDDGRQRAGDNKRRSVRRGHGPSVRRDARRPRSISPPA
jgi:hypothetical protein